MQNFLGSLRSPALFNIIIDINLLKNLENNTCSYIYIHFTLEKVFWHENARFLGPNIA